MLTCERLKRFRYGSMRIRNKIRQEKKAGEGGDELNETMQLGGVRSSSQSLNQCDTFLMSEASRAGGLRG